MSIPGIILEPGCHIREDWKEKFEEDEKLNLKITEDGQKPPSSENNKYKDLDAGTCLM